MAVWTLRRQGYLSPEELALTIETNPDAVLPSELREYLVRYLRGQVRAKPGRKPKFPHSNGVGLLLAQLHYRRATQSIAKWDSRRRERAKRRGETLPRGEEEPHLRAARVLIRRVKAFQGMKPESLRNYLSSHK